MAIQEIVSIGNKYRTMSSGEQKIWKRMSFWTKASDVEFNDGTTAEEKLGTVDADLLSTQGELDRFKENLTKNLSKIANAINKYVTTSTTASVDTMVSNIPKIYAKGQSDLKVARKLTLKANQTGNNVDITDNWYTTCDASAVYNTGFTAGTNAVNSDPVKYGFKLGNAKIEGDCPNPHAGSSWTYNDPATGDTWHYCSCTTCGKRFSTQGAESSVISAANSPHVTDLNLGYVYYKPAE